jgi:integrative and conjugative element protein (TIGR02256 family)
MGVHSDLRFELGGGQSLRIDSEVLKTLDRYRQTLPWKKEAGGQLFGTVETAEVAILHASIPHRRDERGRYHFRSHPETARHAIAAAHARGELFLGEWHTHAQAIPRPSPDDLQAMYAISRRSQINTSRLLLLIRGTAELRVGLRAFLVAQPSRCGLGADVPGLVPLAMEKY